MNSRTVGTSWTMGVLLTLSVLALTLAAQQSTTLVINGQQGAAKVVQVHGLGFTGEHVEIDAAKSGNFHLSGMVQLPKIFGFKYRLQSLQLEFRRVARLRLYSNRD